MFDDDDKSDKVELITFDSLAEMLDDLMAIKHKIENLSHQRKWVPGSRGYEDAYVGRHFDTWEEVKRAVESAWPDGLAALERMRNQLHDAHLPKPQNLRRQARWSEDTGDEICLDRLRKQLPYWRTTHRDHRPGPLSVTILTHTSASWSQSPESILWRGAASIILTELLEEAGYRVELWATEAKRAYTSEEDDSCMAVCLKRTTDTLDVSTVVNAVSGWFYRTVVFGSHWHCTTPPRQNIGRIGTMTPFLIKQITQDENVLQCKNIWDMQAAVTWVKDMLSTFDLKGRQ